MHELDLIERIFDAIVNQACASGLNKVTSAKIKVGRMKGIPRDVFEAVLAMRKETDRSVGALNLEVEYIPVELSCMHCGTKFMDDRFDDDGFAHATSHAPQLYLPPPCPSCKKEGADILTGNEINLVSIEGD